MSLEKEKTPLENENQKPIKKRRAPGMLSGFPHVPESFFFDPLPDDELDLWYGERDAAGKFDDIFPPEKLEGTGDAIKCVAEGEKNVTDEKEPVSDDTIVCQIFNEVQRLLIKSSNQGYSLTTDQAIAIVAIATSCDQGTALREHLEYLEEKLDNAAVAQENIAEAALRIAPQKLRHAHGKK